MDWYAFFRHVGNALNPAWISAILAAIGVIIALTIWWWPRRVFRGSGAAIIALLGEPSCEVMCPTGRGRVGPISRCSNIAYFSVGADRYLLCPLDLDRLREQGYVLVTDGRFELSRLGRLLLEKYDNGRLLARGVARAKRHDRLRCAGGRWLRCRCERYAYDVAGREIPLPFFVGRRLSARMERKRLMGA